MFDKFFRSDTFTFQRSTSTARSLGHDNRRDNQPQHKLAGIILPNRGRYGRGEVLTGWNGKVILNYSPASAVPRVEAAVGVTNPSTIRVRWRGAGAGAGAVDEVNLIGWIATGSDVLSPLRDPDTFQKAAVGDFRASVTWDDDDGDRD